MEISLIGLILLLLAGHSLTVSIYNTNVCSPANVTEPMKCSSEQWVQILQEIYSPRSESTTSCEPNLTSCSAVFYDTDLVANCNGPKQLGLEGCREETSVALAQQNRPCLQTVTDITTSVQYACIDKSAVLDLCGTSSIIKSTFQSVNAYLASPNFPKSTPTGTLCTCTIQGSKVKMKAVDVNVQAKLPWEGDPDMSIDPYRSVFSVSSDGDGMLWQSSQCSETSDCSNHHILNSNLFMPLSEDTSIVIVTYSDFGLYGQNVWVEVVGQGHTLNVTCTSKSLPPNRFITTTTSSTTTTPPTTPSVTTTSPATNTSIAITTPPTTPSVTTTSPAMSTLTIPPTTIVPITKPATTPTIPGTTSLATSTPSVVVYPPTIPPIWITHLSTTPPPSFLTTTIRNLTPTGEDLRAEKSKHDSTALIIILVCILLVFVVIAIVVGSLVYRKRRKFTYNGKVGLKALFLSLYHQMTNREQQEKTDYHDSPFDPIAMDDFKQPTSSPKSKPHYEAINKKTMDAAVEMTDDESKNKQRSGDTTEAKHGSRSRTQQESEKESDLNEKVDKKQESSANIYKEIYQSGYGIVEDEIEQIRQLRNQKPNEVSMENSVSSSSVNGSKTGSGQGNGINYLNSSLDKHIHEDHDQRGLTTESSRIDLAGTNGHFGVDEPETLESSTAKRKIKLDAGLKKYHKNKRDEPKGDEARADKPKGDKPNGDEPKKAIDLKHSNQTHDQMLLSPEEQKMFASLGLSSLDALSESVPDISKTGVRGVGHQNTSPEANVPNSNLKEFQNNEIVNQDVDRKYSPAQSLQSGDLEKSGNQTTLPKKKKLSKSDLVSTILQLSLQDIKQMRTIEHQKGDLAGGNNQTKDMSEC